ncbi:MAG: SDR family NAD(P)-dependent oxidoreductase, partial [Chromatiales bacterium]|nr:SDR family NAD(P)-dependent oxidoreductase [Chromatiales bacterium]
EHARQYLAKDWEVIATARHPEASPGLKELESNGSRLLRTVILDVSDHAGIESVAEELAGESLDILLNNAGTYGPKSAFEGLHYQSLETMDYELWREMHEINVMSAFKVAVCFKPHLEAAANPLLVNMSSDLGSIANNSMGHAYAYRSSKSALNMLTKGMAIEWQNITVIAMAPGWCRTDLGGPEAPVDPVESVRMQQELFERVESSRSGEFINRFGEEVAW